MKLYDPEKIEVKDQVNQIQQSMALSKPQPNHTYKKLINSFGLARCWYGPCYVYQCEL